MIVFLNELSVASISLSREHAVASVRQLIDVLRKLKVHQSRLSINAAEPVIRHKVDREKTVEEVLRGDDYREEWRFLLRLGDRSPFADGLPVPAALDACEYRFEGIVAIALGWAHLLDTAVVSFCYDDCWHGPNIQLIYTELDPDGNLTDPKNCSAKNFSRIHHIEYWRQWLEEYSADDIPAPEEVWATRQDMFPNLRLLDRVRGDLEGMGHGEPAYKQSVLLLQRLSRDLSDWRGVGVPRFSTKVTGESDTRKRYCLLRDVDGETYCFDLHARFTGGFPGRIHFRMSASEQKAVVAYVGFKLDGPIA